MPRRILWAKDGGVLADALGLTPERRDELEAFITSYIARNATLRELIDDLNARDDLTDAEWTSAMFAIGYWQGAQMRE